MNYLEFLHGLKEKAEDRNPATGLTPAKVALIAADQPIEVFRPAQEIAMEFKGVVYIPKDPEMFVDFLHMISSVYWGGVIAGKRMERRR